MLNENFSNEELLELRRKHKEKLALEEQEAQELHRRKVEQRVGYRGPWAQKGMATVGVGEAPTDLVLSNHEGCKGTQATKRSLVVPRESPNR